uniref:Scm-like with four MBT domains protein 1 n=1 Tax=Petromyzon marinus TaxID=7757 RepID=A0AAJ7TTS7_PETMA|nr:scm-like with four MBT domains protein 1 [Petromyzon marinus]
MDGWETTKPTLPGETLVSAETNGELVGSDEVCSAEEVEFNWDEYLEECGATPVPHTAFKHVERSLQSGFAAGMKFEVRNRGGTGTYWVAEVVTTCGQLLLLRYAGYCADRSADFWCDVRTADLHPVGWCALTGNELQPPEAIKEKYKDWGAFLIKTLTGARTAPSSLLEGPNRGKPPMELIVPGSVLELFDDRGDSCPHQHPHLARPHPQSPPPPPRCWPVLVTHNVGGRLRLRYCGLGELHGGKYDRWIFYLHPRLHPLGWAQRSQCVLEPPAAIKGMKSEQEWKSILCSVYEKKEPLLSPEIFKERAEVRSHRLVPGMKLEAVHPASPFCISPATVATVLSDKYFVVEVDEPRASRATGLDAVASLGASGGGGGGTAAVRRHGSAGGPEAAAAPFVCHADSPSILPVQWSLKNGATLAPPQGYSSHDFDWAEYLKVCGAEPAPLHRFPAEHEFQEGMRLEAANPLQPSEICVASVVRVRGRLVWLRLEGLKNPLPDCIVDVESMDIFPVGWCETNGYPLCLPTKAVFPAQKKIAVVQPEKQLPISVATEDEPKAQDLTVHTSDTGTGIGKYCCPRIFFNHRCFSGRYLNKGRIAELPQSVGPGNCVAVLREALSLLINAAYKPSRMLREVQHNGEGRWGGHKETLKAKYKGKSYRATVELVHSAEKVAEFCRWVCVRLECCPFLFGPTSVSDVCPERCSNLTKTRYTHYYGKKKGKHAAAAPLCAEEETGVPGKTRETRGRRRGTRKARTSIDSTPAGSPQNSVDYDDDVDEEEEEEEDDDDDDTIETASSETSSLAARPRTPDEPPRRVPPLRINTRPQIPTLVAPPPPPPPPLQRSLRKRKGSRGGSGSGSGSGNGSGPGSGAAAEGAAAATASPLDENEEEHGKRGKRSALGKEEEPASRAAGKRSEAGFRLESNPLKWSVADVVRFIRSTDCAPLAKVFHEQEIDGQALLLLTLPTVQECMDLKLGPAIKLCHHVEQVKAAFYHTYAN